MVVFLFILTLIVFLAIDFFLRKEERSIEQAQEEKKSPIFLSPDKALKTLKQSDHRLFHLSHSWLQKFDRDHYFIGYDSLIPALFSEDIRITDLPKVGEHILQGDTIWNINYENHAISQLAPLSGYVSGINPACRMNISMPSSQVEQSWILKIKADPPSNEIHNLMSYGQARQLNSLLKDQLVLSAQDANYLNDGGKIDRAFIGNLSGNEWNNIIKKFFPYMEIKPSQKEP